MSIEELNIQIQSCSKCKLSSLKYNIYDLSKGYGKPLGNGGSEIFVIAQNPTIWRAPNHLTIMGVDDELKESGDYFRKFLRELGINTSNIWWSNIVKCSTEGNKCPTDDVINICKEWVFNEIDEIKPKKIICMGSVSYRALIDSNIGMPIEKIWHYAYIERRQDLKNKYIDQLRKALVA